MKKWHLALAVVLVLVLIGLAVVLATGRPKPLITVTCSKVILVGNNVSVTTETKNNTRRRCGLFPVRLEMQDGSNWKEVSHAFSEASPLTSRFAVPLLESHGGATDTAIIKRLPTGTRLRLIFETHRQSRGLEIILLRVNSLIFGGPWPPGTFFSTPTNIFPKAGDVISEEFVAP
jgi:hypothetical protein